MKFEETFTIDHPIDRTWAFFDDETRLAMCVPGVERVEAGDEGRSRVRMTQSVGYLSATFDLRMHVSEREPERALEIVSVGRTVRGAAGDLRSVNRVELSADDGKTRVRLASDVAVGGMLGSVGAKAMGAKASEVAAEFAANVSRQVDAWSRAGDAEGGSGVVAAPAAPLSKPAGLGSQLLGLVRNALAWLASKLGLSRKTGSIQE
jgi:uncharacterized protein